MANVKTNLGGRTMEKQEVHKPKTLMNLRIDEDLRNKFKEKTEEKDTTMSKVTIEFIKKYVKNNN